MKKVETWLNEEEFKAFEKRAAHYKMTSYALLKALVIIELQAMPRGRYIDKLGFVARPT
jgi:hypothetical protein